MNIPLNKNYIDKYISLCRIIFLLRYIFGKIVIDRDIYLLNNICDTEDQSQVTLSVNKIFYKIDISVINCVSQRDIYVNIIVTQRGISVDIILLGSKTLA